MNPKKKTKDPFFGLKYIAFLRTGLPKRDSEVDRDFIFNYAKHQICKVRNVLWNDPVWIDYTFEEVMVEFFAIKFDENPQLRKEFEVIVSRQEDDDDWVMRMTEEFAKKVIIADSKPVEEFEDKFQ